LDCGGSPVSPRELWHLRFAAVHALVVRSDESVVVQVDESDEEAVASSSGESPAVAVRLLPTDGTRSRLRISGLPAALSNAVGAPERKNETGHRGPRSERFLSGARGNYHTPLNVNYNKQPHLQSPYLSIAQGYLLANWAKASRACAPAARFPFGTGLCTLHPKHLSRPAQCASC